MTMEPKELQEHIAKFETEYRWLAKYFHMEFDDFVINASVDRNVQQMVQIMQQFHNDQSHEG